MYYIYQFWGVGWWQQLGCINVSGAWGHHTCIPHIGSSRHNVSIISRPRSEGAAVFSRPPVPCDWCKGERTRGRTGGWGGWIQRLGWSASLCWIATLSLLLVPSLCPLVTELQQANIICNKLRSNTSEAVDTMNTVFTQAFLLGIKEHWTL